MNDITNRALDGDLFAVQALVVERDALRAELAALKRKYEGVSWRNACVTNAPTPPSVPREAIRKLLNDAMDRAAARGADSRSMPDDLVEIAAWLCDIPPSVPDLPPEVVELVRYRNVVSYNDSYFEEPEGLVKRALAALGRMTAPKPGEG